MSQQSVEQAPTSDNDPARTVDTAKSDPIKDLQRIRELTTQYMLEGRPELIEERVHQQARWKIFWAVVAFVCLGTILRAFILTYIDQSPP